MSGMIATGHILALHLQELGLTSLKAEGGEGRRLLAPQQRQLSRTAAQHPETETLLFLGASTH